MTLKLSRLFLVCLLCLPFAGAMAQCPNTSINAHGLFPNPLADGVDGQPYADVDLTVVMPTDTAVTINFPGLPFQIPPFDVTYTAFKIDSTGDVPAGFVIDMATCDQPNCQYTLSSTATNRACIKMTGGTATAGSYLPFVRLRGSGTFVMPAIPFPLPGLPPAGTVINFDSIGQYFTGQLAQAAPLIENAVRNVTYATKLTINPSSVTAVCQNQIPVTAGAFTPADLGTKIKGTSIGTIDCVVDVKAKEIQQLGPQSFTVRYKKITIDSTGGLPAGVTFSIGGCPGLGATLCVRDSLSEVDPGRNRYCFTISGTPTEEGIFQPFLRGKAEGTFEIPAIPPIIPAAVTIDLQNPDTNLIPAQFRSQLLNAVRRARAPQYSTNLRVNPDQFTVLCNPTASFVEGTLHPTNLPQGDITASNYNGGNPVNLTLDFPRTGAFTFQIPGVPIPLSLNIKYTEFSIVEAAGLPAGLNFNDQCTGAGSGCTREVAAIDSAKNRVCFTLSGMPTENGSFKPFLKVRTDGQASAAGQQFLLSQAPTNLPGVGDISQQIDSIRTILYEMSLKVLPLDGVDETVASSLSVYPNPFNASTQVQFNLISQAKVAVSIVDLTGRVVYSQPAEMKVAGDHIISLTPNLTNGVYFVKLQVNDRVITTKVVKN